MAIQVVVKRNVSKNREVLEARLAKIGFKYRTGVDKPYTSWRAFADYLVIRTYNNHYTIHTNGDIDHYEVHKSNYEGLTYELNNFDFINQLFTKPKMKE